MHSGFIAGVGGDVAAAGRSKRHHGKMQWLARTRENRDVFRFYTDRACQRFRELFLEPPAIAPSLLDDFAERFSRQVTRPQRILVGVDDHRAGRKMLEITVDSRSGEQRLIHDAKSGDGRGCGRPLKECPARTVVNSRSLTHSEPPEARQKSRLTPTTIAPNGEVGGTPGNRLPR